MFSCHVSKSTSVKYVFHYLKGIKSINVYSSDMTSWLCTLTTAHFSGLSITVTVTETDPSNSHNLVLY